MEENKKALEQDQMEQVSGGGNLSDSILNTVNGSGYSPFGGGDLGGLKIPTPDGPLLVRASNPNGLPIKKPDDGGYGPRG